jgi:hypothetical protein
MVHRLDDERTGPSVCMTAKGLRQGIGAAERDDVFQRPVPVARSAVAAPRACYEDDYGVLDEALLASSSATYAPYGGIERPA